MKKILFIVCTHGDELAGMKLFHEYPYGCTKHVEWEVVIGNPAAATLNDRSVDTDLNRSFTTYNSDSYESQRALALKRKMRAFDIVYDIHTTSAIKSADLDDAIIVHSIDRKTLTACAYAYSKHIIWDNGKNTQNQFLTMHHPAGITLEYQKTSDAYCDFLRIKSDFTNIINMYPSRNTPKHLYEAEKTITFDEKKKFELHLKDLTPLSISEKQQLGLIRGEEYRPLLIHDMSADEMPYCLLNRKIRDVILFDAWLHNLTS